MWSQRFRRNEKRNFIPGARSNLVYRTYFGIGLGAVRKWRYTVVQQPELHLNHQHFRCLTQSDALSFEHSSSYFIHYRFIRMWFHHHIIINVFIIWKSYILKLTRRILYRISLISDFLSSLRLFCHDMITQLSSNYNVYSHKTTVYQQKLKQKSVQQFYKFALHRLRWCHNLLVLPAIIPQSHKYKRNVFVFAFFYFFFCGSSVQNPMLFLIENGSEVKWKNCHIKKLIW